MKHNFKLDGYCYRLRPIRKSDAQFVIDVRLEDAERNAYIHPISPDVSVQEVWLERYYEREGDFYFVVENRITGEAEGVIAFYDVAGGKAEWGRWVLKKGSLAAAESVYLIYRIAFEQAGLEELCCRTLAANKAVVDFHTSIGERTRKILKDHAELDGKYYDAVEQYADNEIFYKDIAPTLERQAQMVLKRQCKKSFGGFTFHHVGVATKSIEKELPLYTLLGYEMESDFFEDPLQGIRGRFLTADGHPRLELLENLPDSHTLDPQLEANQKLYHTAYYVGDIEKAVEVFTRNRAKVISPLKESVYFGKRICFLLLPTMAMIELLEA